MYTNPFSRTHCTIRQVIDKFFHIDSKHKNSKSEFKRSYSNSSSASSSSSNISWKVPSSKVGRTWGRRITTMVLKNNVQNLRKLWIIRSTQGDERFIHIESNTRILRNCQLIPRYFLQDGKTPRCWLKLTLKIQLYVLDES